MVLFSEAGNRNGIIECLHRFLENAVRLNAGRVDNLEVRRQKPVSGLLTHRALLSAD
jgi:hypothetical protein